MDNKRYDAYGNEFEITQSDFQLTQVDKKIHDKKFDTKATTFAKDALKRFCRNKSSVVAAVIIFMLVLLSFLLPVVTQANIDPTNPNVKETFMLPKIREYKPTGNYIAGEKIDSDLNDNENDWKTGWTGTKVITGLLYDPDLQLPYELDGTEKKYIDQPNVIKELDIIGVSTNKIQQGSYGGVFILKTNGKNVDLTLFQILDFTSTENLNLKLTLSEDDLHKESSFKEIGASAKSEYRIILKYNVNAKGENGEVLVLKDWSKDYGEIDLNISEIMASKGKNSLKNCQIAIQLKEKDTKHYLPIESLYLTTESTDEVVTNQGTYSKQEVLRKMSMTDDGFDQNYDDAAQKNLYKQLNSGGFPVNFWRSNGDKMLYNAYIYKCDIVIDKYQQAYGQMETVDVTEAKMYEYMDKGWCTYKYYKVQVDPNVPIDENDSTTYKWTYEFDPIDKEKCPVIEVKDVIFTEVEVKGPDGNKVKKLNQQLICEITMYKYLGYDSMPKYLLGTDDRGYDIIVYSFNGLKKSFLVSIIISAICLSFGLVWGSISGYFGGNVDLFMERFCEILSGVPSTVVITLVVLLLGDSLLTFGIALCMTGWLGIAGRTRTQFYRFKGREYILASRTLGSSDMRLIFKHILPNSLGTIVTSSVLSIPSVIFSEASLSYLGILKGANSFGSVLSHNQDYINSYPMLIVFPSIIISLIMISFNLFGNGLRDALNPSLKGSE